MAGRVYTGTLVQRFVPRDAGGIVSPAQAADAMRQTRIDAQAIIDDLDRDRYRTSGMRRVLLGDGTEVTTRVERAAGMEPMVYVDALMPTPPDPGFTHDPPLRLTTKIAWEPPLFLAFGKWAIDFIQMEGGWHWLKYGKPNEILVDNAWNSICVGPNTREEGVSAASYAASADPNGVTMCATMSGIEMLAGAGGMPRTTMDLDENKVYVYDVNNELQEYEIQVSAREAQSTQLNTQEFELHWGAVGPRFGMNGLGFGVSLDGTSGSPNHKLARCDGLALHDTWMADTIYLDRVVTPASIWAHTEKRSNHQPGGLACRLDLWFDMNLGLLIQHPDTGQVTPLHHMEYRHYFWATSFWIFGSLTFINQGGGTTTNVNNPCISMWSPEANFYGELDGLAMAEVHQVIEHAFLFVVPWCWFDVTVPRFVQRRAWKRVAIFGDVEIPVTLPTGQYDEVEGFVLSSITIDRAAIVAIAVTKVTPAGDYQTHVDEIADRLVRALDRPDMLVENRDSGRAIYNAATKETTVTYWAVANRQATDVTEWFEEMHAELGYEFNADYVQWLEKVRPVAALRVSAVHRQSIDIETKEVI